MKIRWFKKWWQWVISIAGLAIFVILVSIDWGGGGFDAVATIQEGTFTNWESETIGQAFAGYFEDPQWEFATTEGRNHYVNFEGILRWYEVPVTLAIQFSINPKDKGAFEVYAVEIDGKPADINEVLPVILDEVYSQE